MSKGTPGSTTGCHYFDGRFTDGNKTLRVVGFDTKIQQKLADFETTKEPVALLNCEVKEGKWNSGLEVHMRKSTEVQKSPTKLCAEAITTSLSTGLITLDQLHTIDNFQRINVNIKVITVKPEEEVKKGLLKQDCIISDPTGTATVTLWEDSIGLLVESESYKLSGATVRSFKSTKYLSIPRHDFTIDSIDDIGTVMDASTETRILEDVEVRGVKFFDSYKGCYTCKGKVSPTTDKIGKCNRCSAVQRLDKCYTQITAKLELINQSGLKVLSCFSPIIEEIAQADNVTIEALLFSTKFNAEYTPRGVISKIDR